MISYAIACQIVKDNPTHFWEKKENVGEVYFSVFNYVMGAEKVFCASKDAMYTSGDMLEMRGLTYMHHGPDESPTQYLMLQKFFNINETKSTKQDQLLETPISKITEKIDGSIIRFIELPNGDIIGKSKMTFKSKQATDATLWLKNKPELYEIVKQSLKNRIALLFEWVAPDNRIVVEYKDSDLRLLHVRDEKTGQYIMDQDQFSQFPRANTLECDMPTLLKMRETIKDEEGWVVQFSDNQFVKVKTFWYLMGHKFFKNISDEKEIMRMVLTENIDDIFSVITPTHPEYQRIKKLADDIFEHVSTTFSEINNVCENVDRTSASWRKDFAIRYKKHPYFSTFMYTLTHGYEGGLNFLKSFIISHPDVFYSKFNVETNTEVEAESESETEKTL